MRNATIVVLVFVAGAFLGAFAERGKHSSQKSPAFAESLALDESGYNHPIVLRKAFGDSVQLVPHFVIVGGKPVLKTALAAEGDVWTITLNDGRVQIAATEVKW